MADEKVASLGQVQRVEYTPPAINGDGMDGATGAAPVAQKEPGKDASAADPGQPATQSVGSAPAEVKLTEDQRKAFFKEMGIEYTGEADLEKIKEKLKPEPYVPTEEEKAKAANEREMKLIAKFTQDGKNTVAQYHLIKELAGEDPAAFSKRAAEEDLIEAGVPPAEAKKLARQMYFQIELDAIEQELEETDEDFAERKKELEKKVGVGAKVLASHALNKQNQFKGILKQLSDALEADEIQAKAEATLLSNVDKTLAAVPRKTTYELGKVNDQLISPIEHEVSEESIAKAAAILKDPEKRNNFLFNPDETLNLTNLAELMVNNFELKRALRGALLTGQSRQVEIFRQKFPYQTPFELGIGGPAQKNNGPGTPQTVGKTQRVPR